MKVRLYAQNPNEKVLEQIVSVLRSDGVIIYPTDGIYSFGCSLSSPKALEKIKLLKNTPHEAMAIICSDLSNIANFALVDNEMFRILKRNLPGQFTFILKASGRVPDKFFDKRKQIGVRIPNNNIPLEIVRMLGCPLVSTSLPEHDDAAEYVTDPSLIEEMYQDKVDMIVDGGIADYSYSTIVDCTESEITILREGVGVLS